MAWTTPRTYTTGELVTAAILNTHVRDNLLETAPAKITNIGDLLVGAGLNSLKSLALGAAGMVLKVNTGGNDVEWGISSQAVIIPDLEYDSDISAEATVNYDISLGFTPKAALVFLKGSNDYGHIELSLSEGEEFRSICWIYRKENNANVFKFDWTGGSGYATNSEQFGEFIWCEDAYIFGTNLRIQLRNVTSTTKKAELTGIAVVWR